MAKPDTHNLVSRDDPQAEIRKVFAIHTRVVVGLMVVIAAVAITITELI